MLIFDLHEIGNRLYSLRKSAGMTQAEVAEAADLSDRTYADIERGTVNMRIETLLRICGALDVTPDTLLTTEAPAAGPQWERLLPRIQRHGILQQQTALKLLEVYLDSLE